MEKIAKAWAEEMRRGHTKLAVLTILSKESLTGYDIMKEIEESTLGFWRLTAGGVYPILRKLEEKGYIKGTWKPKGARKRKIYEITDEGKQLLKTALQKQQQIAKTMDGLIHEYARDILDTKLSYNLYPLPLDFFSIAEYLKGKSIEERISLLKKTRDQMLILIKRIDERLEQMAADEIEQ